MPYTAVPDMRMPYDIDGTVVGQGSGGETNGVQSYPSQAVQQGWQSVTVTPGGINATPATNPLVTWLFFPEQREITAYWAHEILTGAQTGTDVWKGSNDTTNGLDGTWETATLSSGETVYTTVYSWRSNIKPISFTGGKRTVRLISPTTGQNSQACQLANLHLYGEKVAGQTPDDIIFIDHDTTPGVEFAAVEDFGDRPLATTAVRQFRVKNTSATLTANGINVQCNDADFAISTDNITYVVTINIASLAPGAESATMYVRNTTPAAGNLLGPRFARVTAIVTSWT